MSGFLFALGLATVLMVVVGTTVTWLMESDTHPAIKMATLLAAGVGLMAAGVVLA